MITVLIATRNRLEKLRRTIETIEFSRVLFPALEVDYLLVFDGDKEGAAQIGTSLPITSRIIVGEEHRGSVYCRNFGLKQTSGDVLYATDDVLFRPGSIPSAVASLDRLFPDRDGVVGFYQEGPASFSPAGVALVGGRFLDRFPDRALFYPGYFHFACQEVHRAAVTLERFYLDPEARLVHRHPSLNPELVDRTHREARLLRAKDRALSVARIASGKTWGIGEGE